MAFFKLTKSATKLTKSAFQYLDKERDELTKLEIAMNKARSNSRKNPGDAELMKKTDLLKRDYAIKKDHWEKQEEAGFKISGFLRTAVYQKGFGGLKERQEKYDLVIKEWNNHLDKVKNDGKVQKKHVGLRRFVLAPSPEEIMGLCGGKKYQNFGKDFENTGAIFDDKEKVGNFLEEVIRDTMKKYQDKYVSTGDQLSYAFSMHYDSKVPHAHIYLCPYTKKGQYLSLNSGKFYLKDQQIKKRKSINLKPENKLDVLKEMSGNSFEKHYNKHNQDNGLTDDLSNVIGILSGQAKNLVWNLENMMEFKP